MADRTNEELLDELIRRARLSVGKLTKGEACAGEYAAVLARMAGPGEVVVPRRVRYAAAHGNTFAEMSAAFQKHPLWAVGDALLVWANEGDLFHAGEIAARVPDAVADQGDDSYQSFGVWEAGHNALRAAVLRGPG